MKVLTSADECEFVVRVVSAGAETNVIGFGIVDEHPKGFGQLPLGHIDFRASIGAWCFGNGGGVVHQSNISRTSQVPGVRDGDIVKIKVEKDSDGLQVSLCKDSSKFHSFHVGGKCRIRMAVSMGTPGQRVEIVDARVQTEAAKPSTLKGVIDSIFDSLPQGKLDDVDLPVASYTKAFGFTWVDILKSVDCDHRDKTAEKLRPRMNTMVTRQVLTRSDQCDFLVKIVSAGGERDVLIFGVVNDKPTGFGLLPIGHPKLPASIGAWCLRQQGGVVHRGNIDKQVEGVVEGDIIKISIQKDSRVSLWKGPTCFTSFKVGGDGKFRLGVSMSTPGQKVEIIDATGEAELIGSDIKGYDEQEPDQVMKVGSTVRLPERGHPRLQEMRTKFVDSMEPHCGKVGKVVEVKARLATIEVDGDRWHWDLDVSR